MLKLNYVIDTLIVMMTVKKRKVNLATESILLILMPYYFAKLRN